MIARIFHFCLFIFFCFCLCKVISLTFFGSMIAIFSVMDGILLPPHSVMLIVGTGNLLGAWLLTKKRFLPGFVMVFISWIADFFAWFSLPDKTWLALFPIMLLSFLPFLILFGLYIAPLWIRKQDTSKS